MSRISRADPLAPPVLLFVVNHCRFLLSHRLGLVLEAREQGFDVHIATMAGPGVQTLRDLGFVWHELPLQVRSVNPAREIRTVVALTRLYRRLKPTLVHHVTMKPVAYGSLASRLARVPAVVNAVSGLGYLFLANGPGAAILRAATLTMMRVGFSRPGLRVIVQNENDARDLVDSGAVAYDQLVLIPGSGVDLNVFAPQPEPAGPSVIVLASRMLRDKGVGEFVQAARILRQRRVGARFVLVGDPDENNPRSLDTSDLLRIRREEPVEWWGYQEDMASVMRDSHIICLPSYREGLPKVLVEAAAAGRPIVTTDVPGCRDVVDHERNGLLVPPGDGEALANALERLARDPALRAQMGVEGRRKAEEQFSLSKIVASHLQLYQDLLRVTAVEASRVVRS